MVLAVQGGSIDCEEDADQGSPSFTFEKDGTRVIKRSLIFDDAGDYVAVNTMANELKPINGLPGQYPITNSLFFVDTAEISPVGATDACSGNFNAYLKWRADVVYRALRFGSSSAGGDEDAIIFLERRTDVSGSYQTIPGHSLYWEQNVFPMFDEAVPAAIRIVTNNYSYTKHYATDVQAQGMIDKAKAISGTVNDADFSSGSVIFPNVKAETLLFQGASLDETFNSDGTRRKVVRFSLQERVLVHDGEVVTWNHLWRPATNKFVLAFRDKFVDPGPQTKPLYDKTANATIVNAFKF